MVKSKTRSKIHQVPAILEKRGFLMDRLLRVPLPSFLAFPDLENGKSDWVQIFTIDTARKIRGHVFERFFFSRLLHPFFLPKTDFSLFHCDKGFSMKKWSDRAEIFTRGGHNAYPGVSFSCLKKSSTLQFLSWKYGKVLKRSCFLTRKSL